MGRNGTAPKLDRSSILVTGFGPFGSERVNPSGLLAARLGGLVLPVAAEEAWELTRQEMNRRGAVAVLALGVAGGREHVCVEKWAANESDYRLADDVGTLVGGPGGDQNFRTSGLGTGLPAAAMARAMRGAGAPARVSRDAGRFVCNHFYFLLLRHLAGRAVFIHVPRLPEEAARLGGGPSLSLDRVDRAVRAGLRLMERRLILPDELVLPTSRGCGRRLAWSALPLAAEPHVAKGLTLELVAAESAVVPGQSLSLGVVLRPDPGFHTYWRQPGLVGLTPSVEWTLPSGFQAGEMLWPEPERGIMAAYGVWCLKREVCLVTPIALPDSLDPAVTPERHVQSQGRVDGVQPHLPPRHGGIEPDAAGAGESRRSARPPPHPPPRSSARHCGNKQWSMRHGNFLPCSTVRREGSP